MTKRLSRGSAAVATVVLALAVCRVGVAQDAADQALSELASVMAADDTAARTVAEQWSEVARRRAAYRQAPREQSESALTLYLEALRELVAGDASEGHPLRAVARIDLAEALLVDDLERRGAVGPGLRRVRGAHGGSAGTV